ncbi:MAG TPA: ABC transporter substrate-binding protein, partial [Actinomycetota bacterium]|nr:ABC transporter substrate-binding protein [Actinomycetota bacterium]
DAASSQACARYAASVGVPYVTVGRSELRMRKLRRFFAISMSLDDQGPLLADFLVEARRARQRENAFITYNSSLYDGVHERFLGAMERRGADVDYVRRLPSTAGPTEARQVVQEMVLAGVENVVLVVRPLFLIQVVDQADTQGFDPSWLASDDPLTLDTVAKAACTQGPDTFDGARAFSATPAFHDRDDFDRRYDRAVRATDTPQSDSTVWLGWAVGRRIAKMLDIAGRDLTRKRFARRLGDATLKPKIMPKVRFGTRDNFGARHVHLLRADCSRDRWVTARSFASGF